MKKLRENQKYQRKPKETNKNLRENQKNKVFKGFRPTIGYVFLVFPKVFGKPTKHSGKPKIPKETKENQKNLRENQTNKVFKGFRPTIGYVLFGCPKSFWTTKKTSGKPKKTNENQENQNNKVFKGFRPTLGYVFFLLLLFVWFSRRFLENQQNIRETQTYQKPFGKTKKTNKKNISKGGSETFKNFVFLVFPIWCGCFWFSLVCLVFPNVFFVFQKLLGQPKKNQTHIQWWV